MPSTSIGDCSIYYEIYGEGVPIVITGGGREALSESRTLALKLANRYRVILWDRTTIGESDVKFAGPRDLDLWAEQLAALLTRLDAIPAYFVAPSNGARVSLVTALRFPEVTRGMLLYLISGGSERAAKGLSKLFSDTADAAASGGMSAVVEMEYWSERIRANAANRGRLLAMHPRDVECTMRRWAAAFDPSQTIMGLSDDDLARIRVPIRVLDATEPDAPMRRYNKELVDRLPNAQLVFDAAFQEEWAALSREYGLGSGHYTEAPSLERLIAQFLTDCGAGDAEKGV